MKRKTKNITRLMLIILTSILIIGIVSSEFCCEKRKDEFGGGWCIEVDNEANCNSNYERNPSSCEDSFFCDVGHCYDEDNGLCTHSPEQACIEGGGEWYDNENCDVCREGCCVGLVGNTQFTTEKRCEILSLITGLEGHIDWEISEEDCRFFSENEGACILEEECSIKTEEECILRGGIFKEGFFCSDVVNTCIGHDHTGCSEEERKFDVYWFDSCGNREDIQDECDYPEGKCIDGVCENISCIDEEGNTRKHLESWCVYDAYVGDSRDVVGSTHWRRWCENGEIKSEDCGDYKNGICAERVIEGISDAQCRVNLANSCYGIDDIEECEEIPDCRIESVYISENFNFEVCVPKYPLGFNINSIEDEENGKDICGYGTQTCTMTFYKPVGGNWKCEKNCECLHYPFEKEMNEFCISLGDCGGYINTEGAYTQNYEISGEYKGKEICKFYLRLGIEPPDWCKEIAQDAIYEFYKERCKGIIDENGFEPSEVCYWEDYGSCKPVSPVCEDLYIGPCEENELCYWVDDYWVGDTQIVGSCQSVCEKFKSMIECKCKTELPGATWEEECKNYLTEENGEENIPEYIFRTEDIEYTEGLNFININIREEEYKLDFFEKINSAIGLSKSKTKTVTFTCLPWKPPAGGDNCSKCNGDLLRPCTEYRCNSLGKACGIINEDSENPICVNLHPDDSEPPTIKAEGVSTEGYKFTPNDFLNKRIEIISETESNGCIREFTTISFNLSTNEYAQCKRSFERIDWTEFDEMERSENLEDFSMNHTFKIIIPDLNNPAVVYIRCMDYSGNFNIDEYIIKFCIKERLDFLEPVIIKTEPESGSFLKYGTDETSLRIILNEPAECKYDVVSGKNYDEMNNDFSCELYEIGDERKSEYSCLTLLENLENENEFYIKCRDKPWVETLEDIEEYGERNTNRRDSLYNIYVTENELKIDSIFPESGSVIEKSLNNRNIDLEVKTSGGVDNGISECKYKFLGRGWNDRFLETDDSNHKQTFTSLLGGTYNISIECKDEVENIAKGSTNFTLNIDSQPPVIINNYTKGNDLILKTDELAECYYHLEKCNFDFDDENVTSITTGLDTEHKINNLDTKLTYHVKCGDAYENKNPDCAIIIEATEENDGIPPIVVRAYSKKGELKLITNEKAKCYFGTFDCVFDLEEGKLMTDKKDGYSTEHSTDWIKGQTYYIKCIDDWGNSNENLDCAIIVEAGL